MFGGFRFQSCGFVGVLRSSRVAGFLDVRFFFFFFFGGGGGSGFMGLYILIRVFGVLVFLGFGVLWGSGSFG